MCDRFHSRLLLFLHSSIKFKQRTRKKIARDRERERDFYPPFWWVAVDRNSNVSFRVSSLVGEKLQGKRVSLLLPFRLRRGDTNMFKPLQKATLQMKNNSGRPRVHHFVATYLLYLFVLSVLFKECHGSRVREKAGMVEERGVIGGVEMDLGISGENECTASSGECVLGSSGGKHRGEEEYNSSTQRGDQENPTDDYQDGRKVNHGKKQEGFETKGDEESSGGREKPQKEGRSAPVKMAPAALEELKQQRLKVEEERRRTKEKLDEMNRIAKEEKKKKEIVPPSHTEQDAPPNRQAQLRTKNAVPLEDHFEQGVEEEADEDNPGEEAEEEEGQEEEENEEQEEEEEGEEEEEEEGDEDEYEGEETGTSQEGESDETQPLRSKEDEALFAELRKEVKMLKEKTQEMEKVGKKDEERTIEEMKKEIKRLKEKSVVIDKIERDQSMDAEREGEQINQLKQEIGKLKQKTAKIERAPEEDDLIEELREEVRKLKAKTAEMERKEFKQNAMREKGKTGKKEMHRKLQQKRVRRETGKQARSGRKWEKSKHNGSPTSTADTTAAHNKQWQKQQRKNNNK